MPDTVLGPGDSDPMGTDSARQLWVAGGGSPGGRKVLEELSSVRNPRACGVSKANVCWVQKARFDWKLG